MNNRRSVMISKSGIFSMDFRKMKLYKLQINDRFDDIDYLHIPLGICKLEENISAKLLSSEIGKITSVIINVMKKYQYVKLLFNCDSYSEHFIDFTDINYERCCSITGDKVFNKLAKNKLTDLSHVMQFNKVVRDYISYIPYSEENEKLVQKILKVEENNDELLQFIRIFAYHGYINKRVENKIDVTNIFHKWYNYYEEQGEIGEDGEYTNNYDNYINNIKRYNTLNENEYYNFSSSREWFLKLIIGYRIMLYYFDKE